MFLIVNCIQLTDEENFTLCKSNLKTEYTSLGILYRAEKRSTFFTSFFKNIKIDDRLEIQVLLIDKI